MGLAAVLVVAGFVLGIVLIFLVVPRTLMTQLVASERKGKVSFDLRFGKAAATLKLDLTD